MAGAPTRRHLSHLDGLRALACTWIVVSHFADPHVPNGLSGVLGRGYVAVDFFIVLSGFTTHYASRDKPLDSAAHVARFHLQRVGRILPLHWACVLLQVPASWGAYIKLQNIVGSLLLLTSWYCYAPFPKAEDAIFSAHQCDFWPLNPLHWTLSTMLFSWLLYPLLRTVVRRGDTSTRARMLVAVVLLALCQLPHLALREILRRIRGSPEISYGMWALLYQWPPLRVPDFLFGMALGQLAHDETVLSWRGWPRLVDLSALGLTAGMLAVPHTQRAGASAALLSGINPVYAVVLVGGSSPDACERSALLWLATRPALVAAGKVSFHMYLLQELLAKAVLQVQAAAFGHCTYSELLTKCGGYVGQTLFRPGGQVDASWWLLYCGLLYGLAAMWYDKVEEPWTRALRRRLDEKLPLAPPNGTAPPSSQAAATTRPPLL